MFLAVQKKTSLLQDTDRAILSRISLGFSTFVFLGVRFLGCFFFKHVYLVFRSLQHPCASQLRHISAAQCGHYPGGPHDLLSYMLYSNTTTHLRRLVHDGYFSNQNIHGRIHVEGAA